MSRKITEKREKILRAAERLFEANGFHATGVDKIASTAGVTKRTLYKHFGSKEGLIGAVLCKHQSQMMDRVYSQVAKMESGDGKRLLVCFDLYQEWFSGSSFGGCIFIKALNEFQQCSDRLFATASEAKSELRDYLAELAKEAGVVNPERLAGQLQLILEGSIVVAQCGRKTESIQIARELAEKTISESFAR